VSPPLLGERHDRPTYRILDRLGDGRGDDVFAAHHEILDGTFVQKTVAMHGLEDALAWNEPAFMHRLEHPRIVPVREAQWDPKEHGAITFVMPHFAGGSVADALSQDYRFSINQAVDIATDGLDALGYLHREHHALHRDTKPGNLLLNEKRRHGYLSDFGSAASIGADGTAEAVLGTNIYRPPESRATGRVGIDADIYGFGMTLFEMLNGRIPWETLDLAKVEARLQRGLRAVPDSQLGFAPHVPERLRRCIRKAIERDPARRPASPETMIRELRRVRCIDWRWAEGSGLSGTWIGTWPPRLPEERRVSYRVVSRKLSSGPHSGKLRVESDFRYPGGGWRQAVADKTITPDDGRALSKLFAEVEANAAQRSPQR
jgi:eukaryotic-like serine/threonine-protein kinase